MAVKAQRTVGRILLMEVDADPSGSITAPRGSLASDSTSGKLYQNTDGGTTWVERT
jgi:hypothetical protein